MGFKAKRGDKEFISIDMITDDWNILKNDSEFKSELIMPCCNARAVMKNSIYNLPFFAHHRKENCNYNGETPEHLRLKKYIYEILKVEGYNVEVEKRLVFDDYYVISDVFLTIDDIKIAFEIQVSQQKNSETNNRSKKYIDNGIIVVWLILYNCKDDFINQFNKTSDKAFAYKTVLKDDTYFFKNSIGLFSINAKEHILSNIKKTVESKIPCIDKNQDELIFYKDDYKYILKSEVIFDDYILVPQKTSLPRKNEDYIEELKVFVFSGFNIIEENILFKVDKTEYVIKSEPTVYIQSNKKLIYKDYSSSSFNEFLNGSEFRKSINYLNHHEYREKVAYAIEHTLKEFSWKYYPKKVIDDKYQLDLIGKYKNNKIVFLYSFYSDPDITKSINYCKKEGIPFIILENYSNHKYDNEIVIDCSVSNILVLKLSEMLERSMKYPFDNINNIDIDTYIEINEDNYLIDISNVKNLYLDKKCTVKKRVIKKGDVSNDMIECYYRNHLVTYESYFSI